MTNNKHVFLDDSDPTVLFTAELFSTIVMAQKSVGPVTSDAVNIR